MSKWKKEHSLLGNCYLFLTPFRLDIRTAVIGDTYDGYWEYRHSEAKLDMAA